jgi:hypothetical protein
MKSANPWPAITAVLVSLAYLSTPSSYYNFDGVACAIAVELGDLSRLAHGNHLAYGLLGLVFDRSWRLLGYQGQAILSLQALDSLLGGLGAGLFCRLLLRRLACSPAAAVTASLGLAFSYAYWFWSLEAQVYMLGAVFMILAADEAFSVSPRPWAVGLWQACAVLGHVGHLMFAPTAVWLLAATPHRRAALRQYGAVLAGTVALAYVLAGLFCVRPQDFSGLRLWLLGSAALKLGGEFDWQTGSSAAVNLWDWTFMTLRVFSDAMALSGWPQVLAWILSAAGIATAAAGAWDLSRPARAALLWLGGYALLFTSWQPHTIVYRVSDLVPFWLLIALAIRKSSVKTAWLGLAVAALTLFNAVNLVLPQRAPERNIAYQEALLIRKLTPEESWIATSGPGQVYVPYFGHRKPLNMRYFQDPGRLEARLAQLQEAGQAVFVPSSLFAADPSLRARFEAYGLEESAREGSLILYTLGSALKK